MGRHRNAAAVADWRSADRLFLETARVGLGDVEWMVPVRSLTLLNVAVDNETLAALPNLEFLDIRGGSGEDLERIRDLQTLRCLVINQVRGVTDVSAVGSLPALQYLELYGLPRVTELPSLGSLSALTRVDIGSMKGLESIAGIIEAPGLRELLFVRRLGFTESDLARLLEHPTLEAFGWLWEDVPDRVAVPVVERFAHLRRLRPMLAEDWFNSSS